MTKENLEGKIAILKFELGSWYSEREEETEQPVLFKIRLKKGILESIPVDFLAENSFESIELLLKYFKRKKIDTIYTPDFSDFYKRRDDNFMSIKIEEYDKEDEKNNGDEEGTSKWAKYSPIASDDEYGSQLKRQGISILPFNEKGIVHY